MYFETRELIIKWLEGNTRLSLLLELAPSQAVIEFLELVGQNFEKDLPPRTKRVVLAQKLALSYLQDAREEVEKILDNFDDLVLV